MSKQSQPHQWPSLDHFAGEIVKKGNDAMDTASSDVDQTRWVVNDTPSVTELNSDKKKRDYVSHYIIIILVCVVVICGICMYHSITIKGVIS